MSAGDTVATYRWAIGLTAKDRWSTPWSLSLAGENFVRTLAHWSGITPAQHLLGPNIGMNATVVRIVDFTAIFAWLVLLCTNARKDEKFGRCALWYLLVVFAVAHIVNPAFLKFCDRSRYIVAMVPAVALTIAFAVRSWHRANWPTRASLCVIFSIWVLVSVIMLGHINRRAVDNTRMLTNAEGDPRKFAADYLTARVDPENDLVICQTWWTYFPIAYYSSEAFPMFSPDLHFAEMVPVSLPTTARKVWYVHLPWANGPDFRVTRVAGWPDAADPTRELAIGIADNPQTAVDWAVTTYATVINAKRDAFRRLSGSTRY